MAGTNNTALQQFFNAFTNPTVNRGPLLTQSLLSNASNSAPVVYSYRVKIINPQKKSEVIVRELHRFSSTFKSVNDIRTALLDEFESQVPASGGFDVGYFLEGSSQTKIWLVTSDDIKSMYSKFPRGGMIVLWCDGRGSTDKRKRGDNETSSRSRQDKEDEVDTTFKELTQKHGEDYDVPKLRLWSRMISTGLHDSYDQPPKVPMFSSTKSPKKHRRESVSEVVTDAAVAVAHAFHSPKNG